LLDFGIGENDDMAEVIVRESLKREVDRVENRGYADNGIIEFKESASRYMKKVFGVDVDPATEVVHAIGSKPAYAMLPAAFIDPGDVTLMTVPGYPVAGTHTAYYGGTVHPLPLLAENDFYPDLDGIPGEIRKKAKILVINYPNSPTGKTATKTFYEKVVSFAKANEIIVVQDAAHSLLSYILPPSSFLAIPGAKEVGVEVHSLSKGFNMIGWRMGFVTGHPKIVQAFADIKDNSDSGQFMAVQKAAAVALDHPEIGNKIREKYKRRLEKLVTALKSAGFDAKMPEGTYFLYTRAPISCNQMSFANAEEASQFLISEQSVCTVPWDDAGPHLRFSVTYQAPTEADEDILMAETSRRLGALKLVFKK
jgi:LL-diaminopimelate aminotransferase